jgi:HEPN domain-containing protein
MTPLTREWLRKGDDDRRAARKLSCSRPPVHDIVCFHCQQAVEKYLKGLLHERGQHTPKIHILEDLIDRLLPHAPSLKPLRLPVSRQTKFAVQYRYPRIRATKRHAQTGMTTTERVRAEVRRLLGLRPRP